MVRNQVLWITTIFTAVVLFLVGPVTRADKDDCTSVSIVPAAYDVIVVGAGPAGLQGALTLGRSLLKTLVIDAGKPRNWVVKDFHNFLGADGDNPAKFRKKQRAHITKQYGDYVTFEDDTVTAISGSVGDFTVSTAKGQQYKAGRILLTVGVQEEVPAFPSSYSSQYYKSIFQCPFCHGFEIRHKKIGVVSPPVVEYPLMIKTWSSDVVIFTNGTKLAWATNEALERLRKSSIKVIEGRIVDLVVSKADELEAVVLEDGTKVERDVLYQKFRHFHQPLITDLKLELDQFMNVKVSSPKMETSVPGIYAAGDLSSSFHKVAMGVGAACQAATFIAMDHRMSVEAML